MFVLNEKSKTKSILISTIMVFLMLFSITTYANEDNSTKMSIDSPYAIIVTGAENIAAYKEAGIIRSYKPDNFNKQSFDILSDVGIMGTSIPTSSWNLSNNNERNFTYSVSTYLYSSYKYIPDPIDLNIWHEITADQVQELDVQCYDASDDSKWGKKFELDIDDVAAFGIATPLGQYYFKYSSRNGSLISGSGIVY
jgi:hypothetical protein